ncbi:hypothetical protein BAE44_0017239 [Dichanthelium oligosanthes]|uniref:PUM-HD domain-containing protein n=1 Tax=Dichanthelium oligosanthes TaxID=888268 RepID=A0A1E5V9P5_9POAL|nr:hypothetical protein BAE44_0017239 [Dichanthelium oligosanthes]
MSRLSVLQPPSTPISSTSQDGSLDPYASALLRALRADASRLRLTREEVRARLLHDPKDLSLLMSAESSAHVVHLLAEGDERTLWGVLARVKPVLHEVMGSSEGHAVFLALLRACEGRFNELKDIVNIACNGRGLLMRAVQQDLGEEALKELIEVVARQPQLPALLIDGLLGESLMEQRKGPVLLRHCFTYLPYENCKIIIRVALATIDKMLSSRNGWRCLAECLAKRKKRRPPGPRGVHLEADQGNRQGSMQVESDKTSSRGTRRSSYFLQHVLRCDSEQLKLRIAERVAENIMELSVHKFGHFVVEACILWPATRAALRRVLDAFLGVGDYELELLVRGLYSSYVLQKLLRRDKHNFPVPTAELATRIEALPPAPNTSAIKLGASIAMEPNHPRLPADPSSSQQQPVQSTLPPERRAIQRPPPPFQQPLYQRPPPPPQYPLPHPQPPRLPLPQRTWSDILAMLDTSVAQSSSTPSFSASQGQTSASGPQAGATDSFFSRGDNASLNSYASALLRADQVDRQSGSWAPVIPQLTQVEDRALQHVQERLPGNVVFGCSSAHAVMLLKEGDEEVRASLFGKVMGALQFVMGSSEWCVVFVELIRAGRFDELQKIVNAACQGEVSLMQVAENECGYVILEDFRDVLSSTFGPMSMVECFAAAENLDLPTELEEMILTETVGLAKGKYSLAPACRSNHFLQAVLERGGDLLKERITTNVLEHLVDLSVHQCGTRVVQACFLRTGTSRLPLLQRVLAEFQRLPVEQLARLVQDRTASFVVSELLQAGKDDFPDAARELALRIQTVPAARREEADQTPAVKRFRTAPPFPKSPVSNAFAPPCFPHPGCATNAGALTGIVPAQLPAGLHDACWTAQMSREVFDEMPQSSLALLNMKTMSGQLVAALAMHGADLGLGAPGSRELPASALAPSALKAQGNVMLPVSTDPALDNDGGRRRPLLPRRLLQPSAASCRPLVAAAAAVASDGAGHATAAEPAPAPPAAGDDVVGESPTDASIPSNIWAFDFAGTPVAAPSSIPNFINNQYLPWPSVSQSGAAALFSASGHNTSLGMYAFVPRIAPFAAPSFDQWSSASHWASLPSSSANGPQPGAATASFLRGHNASLDPRPSACLIAPLANLQTDARLPLELFWAKLLCSPMRPDLVMFREIAARVVIMLDQGDLTLHLWVLNAVLGDAHMVIGSDVGAAVFVALLRAVERAERLEDLYGIVQAAASPFDSRLLMGVANRKPGEIALKALFRVAAARGRQLCRPLIDCFVHGWIMERSNGPELLQHFFTTFSSAVSPSPASLEVLTSDSYIELKDRIRSCVKWNLRRLSRHCFGNYVVQACYVPNPRHSDMPLLSRGLDAFLDLDDVKLLDMVHDRFGNHVLSKLLYTGNDTETPLEWTRTVDLARRIQTALGTDQDRVSARQVASESQSLIESDPAAASQRVQQARRSRYRVGLLPASRGVPRARRLYKLRPAPAKSSTEDSQTKSSAIQFLPRRPPIAMDATQPSAAAASTKPAAPIDPAALSAYFRVMQLGDPSSPREQPQPPKVPAPTTRPEVLMMQQLQAAQQYCYPPQPQSYCVGESSTGAGYVPPYASHSPGSFCDSHFGEHSPRLHAPAAPTPSVTPKPGAGAGHFDPIAPSYPSESPSSSTPSPSPSPSASHYQFIPSAPNLGTACFARDPNSSLNPYASGLNPYAEAFQNPPHANPAGYGSWMPAPEVPYYPTLTLEQVRSRLLRRPMESNLLMFPETAAHVFRLLVEDDEQARRSVLARVRSDVRSVMGSNERHAVLLALIRACAERLDELQDIVHAVYKGNGYLMGDAKNNYGLAALWYLIKAVAPHAQLLVQLICWLLREGLMEQLRGAELLQHCFTRMSYEDSKVRDTSHHQRIVIIKFATLKFNELIFSSSFGSRCLAECFVHARGDELRALEEIVLNRTIELAMGQYSNYFLQRVIEYGREPLQAAIADAVADDVVNLSLDRFGSYVVEACFLLARTPAPLHRLLGTFLMLPGEQLSELVRGDYSNYVVSKLLDTARNHFPQEARVLARHIEKLPPEVQREMHARAVMKVVGKLTQRHLRRHALLY